MTDEPKFSAAVIARARAMYAQGATVADIRALTGMGAGTLYFWLDGGSGEGEETLPPIPRRREAVLGQRRKAVAGARPSLIARLWRTAERQVAEIETRLGAAGGDPGSLERDAKTLSVLARTVRDLVALDEVPARAGKTEETDDEPHAPLRDLDTFRRELAQKLAELGALEAGD